MLRTEILHLHRPCTAGTGVSVLTGQKLWHSLSRVQYTPPTPTDGNSTHQTSCSGAPPSMCRVATNSPQQEANYGAASVYPALANDSSPFLSQSQGSDLENLNAGKKSKTELAKNKNKQAGLGKQEAHFKGGPPSIKTGGPLENRHTSKEAHRRQIHSPRLFLRSAISLFLPSNVKNPKPVYMAPKWPTIYMAPSRAQQATIGTRTAAPGERATLFF